MHDARRVGPAITMSTASAVILVLLYALPLILLTAQLGSSFYWLTQWAPLLLPMAIAYPFVVAALSVRTGSTLLVQAIAAVVPAISAAALGIRAPYPWRDVVAPLAIGLGLLVAIWVAQAFLARRPRFIGNWSLVMILLFLVGLAAFAFVGVLLIMSGTTRAPF
jgi:hypothetical protein